MERMKRNGWNLQSMNDYCTSENNGYTVLETEWKEKPYQKQLWAFVKCKNEQHEAYWCCWNNFLKEYFCKKCDYENRNRNMWSKDQVIEFYKQYGLIVMNVSDWHTVDKPIEVEDEIRFKYMASITTIKQSGDKSKYIFNIYNPFSIYNLNLYCKLYRKDYELVSTVYSGIKSDYLWKYNGSLLPETENRIFELMADSFINGGCGHPYFGKSNGNKIFESELIRNNIEYKSEKKFKGCRDKYLLKFDFYLLKLNEIIEIDGLQHTTIIDFFGGEQGYQDRVKKDNIKNEYCKSNGIKITRIQYRTNKVEAYKKLVDDKIKEILNKISM